MLLLPSDILALLVHFAPLFSRQTWRHVPILVVGALLAPGRRMVSSALRAVGLAQVPTFQTYHRLLNRAVWSGLDASRILLRLLVATFAASGPVVLGIDETIETRRLSGVAARRSRRPASTAIRCAPAIATSSKRTGYAGSVSCSSCPSPPIPWAGRVWALPFLTALAPSDRYAQERGQRHKSIGVWARQLIRLVHRWLPDRQLVIVGDRGYASLDLLAAVRPAATFIRLSSRGCVWTPTSAPRRLHAHPIRSGVHAWSVNGSRRLSTGAMIPPPSGCPSWMSLLDVPHGSPVVQPDGAHC